MLRLIAALLQLISDAYRAYTENQLKEQGRKQLQDQLDANEAAATRANTIPDPARDERLRAKFDAAAKD